MIHYYKSVSVALASLLGLLLIISTVSTTSSTPRPKIGDLVVITTPKFGMQGCLGVLEYHCTSELCSVDSMTVRVTECNNTVQSKPLFHPVKLWEVEKVNK